MKKFYRIIFILGFVCYGIGIYYIWELNRPNRLAFKNYAAPVTIADVSSPPPVRITIPDVNIDLPIIPSKIEKGQWGLSTQGASYLSSSPIPGDKGNSIIYAHNWTRLFGPLQEAQLNNEVHVEFADKTKKSFTIKDIKVVEDDEVSILAPSDDRRLTLYTCMGFLDSKRMVAIAVLN